MSIVTTSTISSASSSLFGSSSSTTNRLVGSASSSTNNDTTPPEYVDREFSGRVKSYSANQRYGFIERVDSVPGDVRFNRSDLPGQLYHETSLQGRQLRFKVRRNEHGKWAAFAIQDPKGTDTYGSVVKSWNATKGFGFIECPEQLSEDGGGKDIFLGSRHIVEEGHKHVSDLTGQRVLFSVEKVPQGLSATFVRFPQLPVMLGTAAGGIVVSENQVPENKRKHEEEAKALDFQKRRRGMLPTGRQTGTISSFVKEKYGFVKCSFLEGELYFPADEGEEENWRPGDTCTFEVGCDEKSGKLKALAVRRGGAQNGGGSSSGSGLGAASGSSSSAFSTSGGSRNGGIGNLKPSPFSTSQATSGIRVGSSAASSSATGTKFMKTSSSSGLDSTTKSQHTAGNKSSVGTGSSSSSGVIVGLRKINAKIGAGGSNTDRDAGGTSNVLMLSSNSAPVSVKNPSIFAASTSQQKSIFTTTQNNNMSGTTTASSIFGKSSSTTTTPSNPFLRTTGRSSSMDSTLLGNRTPFGARPNDAKTATTGDAYSDSPNQLHSNGSITSTSQQMNSSNTNSRGQQLQQASTSTYGPASKSLSASRADHQPGSSSNSIYGPSYETAKEAIMKCSLKELSALNVVLAMQISAKSSGTTAVQLEDSSL
ncbi:unnamed protein product [Amoebophrya sp. A25]|nr:unnamed protein product [Amoebophrya sp. A25]|eukprot:GSA25T00021914001.1